MGKLIGDDKPGPEALAAMRKFAAETPGTTWAAYQNHDLGHYDVGHLRFMAIGPGCTFKTAPERHPDTPQLIGWRYIHVGTVNLETGQIEEG
jgi:hypothetical protein